MCVCVSRERDRPFVKEDREGGESGKLGRIGSSVRWMSAEPREFGSTPKIDLIGMCVHIVYVHGRNERRGGRVQDTLAIGKNQRPWSFIAIYLCAGFCFILYLWEDFREKRRIKCRRGREEWIDLTFDRDSIEILYINYWRFCVCKLLIQQSILLLLYITLHKWLCRYC